VNKTWRSPEKPATHRQLADLTSVYAETGKGTQADHDRDGWWRCFRRRSRGEEAVKWRGALTQQLSLDPQIAFQPNEPTVVPIELVPADPRALDLVARGLSHRPEIAESRQLIGEAVERLQREIRRCSRASSWGSAMAGSAVGGGDIKDFSNSFDSVAGAFWECRNLGFGDRAARCEARSRVEQAQFREVAALDRVAREVVEAHAQVQSRREQIATAQQGVQAALASYERNLDRIKNVQGLPIEVLQAIQALTQARREYLRSLIAYNEAQFRLQRALGWPETSDSQLQFGNLAGPR
jgi:outer membrane protein TolC